MVSYILAAVAFPSSTLWLQSQLAHGPHYGHKTPSALETHHEKSSEVFIPVLQHVKLHFGSGSVSVLKIMIKIAISHGPH